MTAIRNETLPRPAPVRVRDDRSRVRWTIDRDVDVPMRDGVLLRADVWRVDDDLPRPTVLFRTPYDKSLLTLDTLRPGQCLERGYHVVVQDTRGRFASEGEWAALMWEQEAIDTYDTVEWVARQPWCDRNVAMAGTSYLGIVQWLGATRRPPHLRAIAPAMTTSLQLDLAETGGAFRLDQIFSWFAFMAAEWLQRQLTSNQQMDPSIIQGVGELVRDPTLTMTGLPVGASNLLAIPGFPLDLPAVLAREIEHVPSFDVASIDIPTLSVGGWYDVFCRATVEQFRRLRSSGGGGPETRAAHRLIMGPWAHGGTLPHFQGEMNFGVVAGASAARLPDKHLRFFDAHLRGTAEDDAPPVLYFLCGANEWRTADDWPPAQSSHELWYLHSAGTAGTADDGRLALHPPTSEEPADGYTYDPADPVPTRGGRALYLGRLVGGPLDQSHIERRDDVVCYSSPRLDAPVDIAGNVGVTLFVSSTAPDSDFVAKLCDVCPDGRSIVVCDGSIRARYRFGFDEEVPLRPGELVEMNIDLGDVAWRFSAGHRFRLLVTSSNFPLLDRNLNTGRALGEDADGLPARQQILHSATYASHVSMPVLRS